MLSQLRGARMARSYSVKVKSFDTGRAVSEVSLKVRAGSRFESVPGAAHLLASYAYGNTASKSALRLTREAELLGGSVSASHDRQHVTYTAKFLREDLPYFVSALANLAKNNLYQQYEYDETILPLSRFETALAYESPETVGLEAAHEVAFRNGGLGNALYVGENYVASNAEVKAFAKQVFTEGNVKVYGKDVNEDDLKSLVAKELTLPAGEQLQPQKPNFYGGEKRIDKAGLNTVVISFPTERDAQLEALKFALSNKPVKWGSNLGLLGSLPADLSVKTVHNAYHDASLLSIVITGVNAAQVKAAAIEAAALLKKAASSGISAEAEKRAVASAKVALAEAETNSHKLAAGAVPESLDAKAAIAKLVGGKPVLVAVGNTRALPYLDELF